MVPVPRPVCMGAGGVRRPALPAGAGGGLADRGAYGMVAPNFRWVAMKSLMILRYCLGCLLGAVLVLPGAQAARLDDLFEAEVAATGRDSAARDAATQLALQQVLERITGGRGNSQQASAGKLLAQPGRFVEQYHFRESAGASGPALTLWVKFDGVTLAREVRELGLPYWGPDRPDTLVWLAVDSQGQRYLVGEAPDSLASRAVLEAGRQHGLPVTLPLLDLEDQRAVDFTDIWGGFLGPVETASQRYRPQVILVGKVGRAGASGWQANWTLLAAGSSQSWSAYAATLEAAVAGGVGHAAESLAEQYAVVATGQSMRRLVVDGIRGLEDYARVYSYLESLTPVDQVQVVRVSDQEIEFELKLNAQDRALLQLITLGRTLRAADDPLSWRFSVIP